MNLLLQQKFLNLVKLNYLQIEQNSFKQISCCHFSSINFCLPIYRQILLRVNNPLRIKRHLIFFFIAIHFYPTPLDKGQVSQLRKMPKYPTANLVKI